MTDTVLILGASGRFGRATTRAFAHAGWQVRTLTRREFSLPDIPPIDARQGDAGDVDTLTDAARGADVIVHAINPAYGRWAREALPITQSVIAAAERSGATILLPGNVYAYGSNLPARLDETTAFAPSEPLGQVRADIERALREASDRGVRSIVLRAGDFIEGRRSGNWFEDHLLGKLDTGKVTYPGPLDRAHAWAWLPDVADAAVGLATIRDRLAAFESVGFPGWNLTGQALVTELERLSGQGPLTVRPMPWWLLRLAAPFSADIRGVLSMRWLWERPHAIDGTRLNTLLPEFRATAPDTGLAVALERLGLISRSDSTAEPATEGTTEARR